MNPHLPTPAPEPAPELIEAAAAAWLSLRDRGMSPTETAAFVRWLQEDPRHAALFSELDQTWRDLNRLSAAPEPGTREPDPDLLAPRVRPARRRVPTWAALGAAAAAVALLLAVTHLRVPRPTAATAVGALQTLDLADGSRAQLNTDSAITVAYTAAERQVRVLRGEVHFTVSKDPARPFLVTAGPVTVRAIGTAFNVRQRADTVEVLVTEGRVQIDDADRGDTRHATPETDAGAPPQLVAGERAWIPVRAPRPRESPMMVEQVTAPEIRRALAWQERRLEFDAAPLSEVAFEFNRYNRRQLVIADPALAERRFSGTFRADGYEALVRLLENDFGVQADRGEHEIRLRAGR